MTAVVRDILGYQSICEYLYKDYMSGCSYILFVLCGVF